MERGYRWIQRGSSAEAIATFQRSLAEYPNNSLAHLGLGEAFALSGQEADAVDMYSKALPLLRSEGYATPESANKEQTIGRRFFSYQNQGLTFPYGVEAYLHVRRGLAYEALAKKLPARSDEFRAAAQSDYASANNLAPAWDEPRTGLKCLDEPTRSECT